MSIQDEIKTYWNREGVPLMDKFSTELSDEENLDTAQKLIEVCKYPICSGTEFDITSDGSPYRAYYKRLTTLLKGLINFSDTKAYQALFTRWCPGVDFTDKAAIIADIKQLRQEVFGVGGILEQVA
jgi:hypothetical protein